MCRPGSCPARPGCPGRARRARSGAGSSGRAAHPSCAAAGPRSVLARPQHAHMPATRRAPCTPDRWHIYLETYTAHLRTPPRSTHSPGPEPAPPPRARPCVSTPRRALSGGEQTEAERRRSHRHTRSMPSRPYRARHSAGGHRRARYASSLQAAHSTCGARRRRLSARAGADWRGRQGAARDCACARQCHGSTAPGLCAQRAGRAAMRSGAPDSPTGCTATKRNSCSRSVKAATDAGVAGTSNRTTQSARPASPPASSQLRLLISPVAGRAMPRDQNIAALRRGRS